MKHFALIISSALLTILTGMGSNVYAIPAKNISSDLPIQALIEQEGPRLITGEKESTIDGLLTTNVETAPLTGKPKVVESFGRQAMHFEPNLGQSDDDVEFTARGQGYNLYLTRTEAVFSLAGLRTSAKKNLPNHDKNEILSQSAPDEVYADPEILRMQLGGRNLNKTPRIKGLDKQIGVSNYYLGKDKTKWLSKVPHYSKVEYENVYPGINLVYYGNPQQLEYDFVVAPGADPDQIQLVFTGADDITIDDSGNLNIKLSNRELVFKAPVVYQMSEGKRERIAGSYIIQQGQLKVASKKDNVAVTEVGFQLAAYDASLPLVIDPVIVYSTFVGGGDYYQGVIDIATDAEGNAYLTGNTYSSSFPVVNAYQDFHAGGDDARVTKLNSIGQIVYSTYLGGIGFEEGVSIVANETGDVFVTGWTASNNFPTKNAYQDIYNGGERDAFLTQFSAEGQLVYSSYYGGSGRDQGGKITTNSSGVIFMAGITDSTNLPVLNGLQNSNAGGLDVFVTQLGPERQLTYATYLGGDSGENVSGVTIDAEENIYLAISTGSNDLPLINPVHPTLGDNSSNYIVKYNGGEIIYSRYLSEQGYGASQGIGVDANGDLYVLYWGHISRFNEKGEIVFSAPYGGKDIAVDANGNSYITGFVEGNDLPVTDPLYPYYMGSDDAFVTQLNNVGQVLFSTYLGGIWTDSGNAIAVDPIGNIYVAGKTESYDFPVVNAFSEGQLRNSFITKIDMTDDKWNLVTNYSTALYTFAVNWIYQWNENGPLGDSSNYSDMVKSYRSYNSNGSSTLPTDDELSYGFLFRDGGHPGMGVEQGVAADRYVIAGYEVNQAGSYRLSNSHIQHNGCTYSNGLDLRIFLNNVMTKQLNVPADGGVINFDHIVGQLVAGDRIYVAIGPDGQDGCDGFLLDYDLERFTGDDNHLPGLINPGDQTTVKGTVVDLTIYANDPDLDVLTYTLSGSPPGLVIDSQTGMISGIPTQIGQYNVTVNVDDGYESVSVSFNWDITLSGTFEDLSSWESLNGIEVEELDAYSYQLIHSGSNWPILSKDLPTLQPGAQLKVSFKGKSNPAGALLQIKPWYLAMTGGGHVYLTETEASYERIYSNETANDITDAQLRFFFEDSLASGAGQTITISDLRFEITGIDSEIKLIPTDDANNRATLEGLLAVSKWEHAFFRFDLTGIEQAVTKATLRVYDDGRLFPHTLSAGAVNDDSWTEDTSTPAITLIHLNPDVLLDSAEVTDAGYVELDVTSFIASQTSGDGIATLELSTELNQWNLLSSKEGVHPPELLIETGE